MVQPCIVTDTVKLRHNLEYLSKKLQKKGIAIAGVTKVFSAHPELVSLYNEIEEITFLADSRMANLKSYPNNLTKEKILLRIPMLSEAEEVVRYADISLNSEIETVRRLNQKATELGKIHQIILMVDLGDLREGIFSSNQLMCYIEEILKMEAVSLVGLGVNLTCYGAIIPEPVILQKLIDYKQEVKKRFAYDLKLISGGNSSSLYLLDEAEGIPDGINLLRIGEAFVLGVETAFGRSIPEMYQNVFTLSAEIIEYKDKPSLPIGNSGQDAFGEKPVFEDKGEMRRGILAIGRQDISHQNMIPRDSRLQIIGSSSDHTIIDFTNAKEDYQIGGMVEFDVTYGGLLSCFTSQYVDKKFI